MERLLRVMFNDVFCAVGVFAELRLGKRKDSPMPIAMTADLVAFRNGPPKQKWKTLGHPPEKEECAADPLSANSSRTIPVLRTTREGIRSHWERGAAWVIASV